MNILKFTLSLLFLQLVCQAQTSSSHKIGGYTPHEITKLLGAKGVDGATDDQLKSYSAIFSRTDSNNDNRHSEDEYVKNSRHMTPNARKMTFRAANNNSDSFVTLNEYVLNRIITDEAKSIIQPLDTNKDRKIQKKEFIKAFRLEKVGLSLMIFEALDVNDDGELTMPEYLRVGGQWARYDYKKQEQIIEIRLNKLAVTTKNKPNPKVNKNSKDDKYLKKWLCSS